MGAPIPSTPARRGVLLVAHGARDAAWAQPFEAVAQGIRNADPALSVALAFLEFMSPQIVEAGHALAAEGCARVDLVPLFLGAGGHVRKDLPLRLAELAAAHPQTAWHLQPAVGETDRVIQAMVLAALELVAPSGASSSQKPERP